ncbi:PREDICTED: homeobox protein NANOG [Odobenus rosmarus divergens]|uniref:Homeobox protein NANOG n=1 Tax=Odobenus rosmarus divergens TaxID=9708 RepID=A0A2U3WPA6_ODORO|nr:PREDICTED: homeobox protein NANOG [Odobenus rosmarus divergens]
MSADPALPQCPPGPEAPSSRDSSPMPEIYGPEENDASLQMSSAETPHAETVSPLPASKDLRVQDSPDSSTSPRVKVPPTSGEERTVRKEDTAQGKKQKIRTVFSQAQLYVLNDRFQRQKYLSLQQMQELSNILNLSYKQVKTWFQNQRMKCKRWQKNHWPKESKSVTQSVPGRKKHTGLICQALLNFTVWIQSSKVGGLEALLTEFQAPGSQDDGFAAVRACAVSARPKPRLPPGLRFPGRLRASSHAAGEGWGKGGGSGRWGPQGHAWGWRGSGRKPACWVLAADSCHGRSGAATRRRKVGAWRDRGRPCAAATRAGIQDTELIRGDSLGSLWEWTLKEFSMVIGWRKKAPERRARAGGLGLICGLVPTCGLVLSISQRQAPGPGALLLLLPSSLSLSWPAATSPT